MGDVITRFKLETTQYDSKLRDSVKGLKEIVHMNLLAGNQFREFSEKSIEAARALGQQATGATNAKDKVKELVSSYNEMAKTYNLMSDAMKKSEGGKALAASLEQLQQRINDAKAEMNATPGILDKLASKFTVNIDALKLFNVGLQAAEGALGVARDAFFKNDEQLDTWGRVVEASQSLYSGFLDALNTGDISGYLTRIGEITKAAQDAYNALDALNTFNAFNQVNVEKTRTGMTKSIADYRSGQGSREQVKAAGEAYQKELRERQKLEKKAYLEAIKKVASERGVNGQDLITALSGSYGSYESLKSIPMSGTRTKWTGGGMFGGSVAYEEEYPVNRQEKLGAALRKLNDTELQSLQALGAQAERTGNEIAQVDKQLTRVLNGRQPGAGGGGGKGSSGGGKTGTVYAEGSIAAQAKLVSDLTKKWNEAGGDMQNGYLHQLVEAEKKLKEMQDQQKAVKEMLTNKPAKAASPIGLADGMTKSMKEIEDELAKNPIKLHVEIDTEKVKSIQKMAQIQKTLGNVADAANSIGQAFNSIEDPAAKVAGTVAQAIATMALAYAQASAATSNEGWGWIAFAATGLATMMSSISAIHSATGYSEGGMIKGNSYSGDLIPANGGMIGLNAGEVVLNRAQQNTLASELQGGGGGSDRYMPSFVSGEQIWIALNAYTKRTGRGELVTWR